MAVFRSDLLLLLEPRNTHSGFVCCVAGTGRWAG
jgi:hypothetical protein